MSNWVSVKERLPPEDRGIIGWVSFNPEDAETSDYEFVYHTINGVFQAYIDGVYQDMPEFWRVTHWIPLPEPPAT